MRRMSFTKDENIGVVADRAVEHGSTATIDMCVPSRLTGQPVTVLTVPAIAQTVAELAGSFAAAGVRQGDRVAVTKDNHFDFLLLAAGIARLGALPALISPSVSNDELAVMLDRLDPSLVVGSAQRLDEVGEAVFGRAGGMRAVDLDGADPRAIPFDDLRNAPAVPPTPASFDEPMVVTHTSGTTGIPKMVVNSAASIRMRARLQTMPVPVLSFQNSDRYVAYIAWMHARGVDAYVALMHGSMATMAMPDGEPQAAGERMIRFRPTIVDAVPNAMLRWESLARTHREAFDRVRAYVSAFDAVHPRTVRTFLDATPHRWPVWLQAYGQSESGGITLDVYTRSTVDPSRSRVTLRSMGRPVPLMTGARIVDPESGRVLPRGAHGQICVRSPGISLDYLGQSELHAQRRRGRWWTMGDHGYRTRTGKVVLLDREIDLVDGIESCLSVEDVLLDRLPDVVELVVVDGPEGRPTPVVCTEDGRPIDPVVWRQVVADFPALTDPVHLPWHALPRTGTLKVRRHQLRALIHEMNATEECDEQGAEIPARARPATSSDLATPSDEPLAGNQPSLVVTTNQSRSDIAS